MICLSEEWKGNTMKNPEKGKSKYNLNEAGEFIIDNFNSARPFSSFFPGIAGKTGIPMWVFYVNRGQCISSMGIRDKDHSILEFLPANRAYNLTASHGFRTFLKLPGNNLIKYYEPFQNYYRDIDLDRSQRMIIAPSYLALEEINTSLKLRFRVDYFTVPKDQYAGIVRTLRIQNMGRETISLEGLDGLPLIVPYGVDNSCLKNMRRTIEAFVEVCNFSNQVPFFKAKVEPADRPDVLKITSGNFYLGFESIGSETNIIDPIVDPNKIFGDHTDFSYPERFLTVSNEDMVGDQKLENQFPCAMGIFNATIPAGESYTYSSIIGHAFSLDMLNRMIGDISQEKYIEAKAKENRELIETLTQSSLICSNEPALDQYARQNFLDNTMRGGFPFTLDAGRNNSTLYLFSRKHGDMERDYNEFSLMPTNYSQGNGNFRDINQNRRSDLFFNPDLEKENVKYFYDLIQLDGFNPLVLKETYFKADDPDKLQNALMKYISPDQLETVFSFTSKVFTPGELLAFLDKSGIALNVDLDRFIAEIVDLCRRITEIDYGESYWIDHWTYNLDLLENYLAVYPDKFRNMLFEEKTFSFYDNPHVVQPRDEKYVLWNGKPRQLGAVLFDKQKAKAIERRGFNPNMARTDYGQGDVYYTTLFNKLICIIINKLSSLDPEGVGVEMEAGKPGWYDALNGLPGLFGSSISETLEIKRHVSFLLEKIDEYDMSSAETMIFYELKEFMDNMHEFLDSNLSPFGFWENASNSREHFREKIRMGISGKEIAVGLKKIREFLVSALDKLNSGIEKARDEQSNSVITYFRYEVVDYSELQTGDSRGEMKQKYNANRLPCIRPLKFKQIPLPLFLEGPVHYLRCLPEINKAREFASAIKSSLLYDEALKMYKVNASLKDESMEIGRARVFSPGWLENESIWLHMEYKYMLELLRNKLYKEFYGDFKDVFVPFFKPEVYGRSILENSSFIVSSANPDPSIHGRGFVARLTGATAEFIHILLLMALGQRPFSLDTKGDLQFCPGPCLPGWLFTQEERKLRIYLNSHWQEIQVPAKSFSFMLFGKILFSYHNETMKDTYGEDSVKPVEFKISDSNGNVETFKSETLNGDMAYKIRNRQINRIDVKLG